MHIRNPLIRTCLLLAPAVCMAQRWEIGGSGGGAFVLRDQKITRGASTAEAGIKNSYLASFYAGHHSTNHLSGEIRYSFRPGDYELKAGSQQATFNGESHLIHYDMLVHMRSIEAPIRPFIAFGGGVRVLRGTGNEGAVQPGSDFALLSKTREVKPMLSVGAGVRASVAPWADVRFEFRDFVTQFPSRVITPNPGARAEGWLHDLTGMVGFSVRF
jgi:hypothetical protein